MHVGLGGHVKRDMHRHMDSELMRRADLIFLALERRRARERTRLARARPRPMQLVGEEQNHQGAEQSRHSLG